MENLDQQYLMRKRQSDSPEDLIGRLLFQLIALKNTGNAQDKSFFLSEAQCRNEETELGQTSILQREAIENVLLEIKNIVEEKTVDFSEVSELLVEILGSNSALYGVLERIDGEYPEMQESLSRIAKSLDQNKPQEVVFGEVIASQEKSIAGLGKLLVTLTEEVKKKQFPKEIKISDPVEIAKPKWWQEFSFEPLKELVEKIKAHTFSVKVTNQEKQEQIDIDKLAKKIGGEMENAIKQMPRSGGMGNPFAFDDQGNLKVSGGSSSSVDISTLATEATQQQVRQAIENITIPAPVGGATEVNQLTGLSIIPWLKGILTKIAYPAWFDPTANVIRNQVQSGTITTVTTVTTVAGVTNIDGYQGKLLVINQNISAWANCVRGRIS